MRWPGGISLTRRLTAGVLLLLIGTCAVLGLATAVGLHRFLVGRLDQQLVTLTGQYGYLASSERYVPSQLAGTLLARKAGDRLVKDRILIDADDEPHKLTEADRESLAQVSVADGPVNVELGSFGWYRIIVTEVGSGNALVLGLPLRPVDIVVGRLVLIEVIGFSIVIVGAGILGALFVRSSLRPLHKVAATASEVTALPLSSGKVALPERVAEVGVGSEVGQVSAAFNAMLNHVEGALASRQETEDRLRQFIADASHELRTPLAVIRSQADLARRELTPVPERAGLALTRVDAETVRMGQLVDDLLLLARLDAGRPLATEAVDLSRLALEATQGARATAPQHRWVLALGEFPVEITGDSARLHQVLSNLLANASAHTPPGTTVTIQVHEPQSADTSVMIDVTDDGPGIPPELQVRIFQRFTRGDQSRSRSTGGTGLGLAIANAVVAAHHGTISLRSRPGETRFRVRLPRGVTSTDDQAIPPRDREVSTPLIARGLS